MATKARKSARDIRLESVVTLKNELNHMTGEAPVSEDWVNQFVGYKLYEIGDYKEKLIKKIENVKHAQLVEAYFAGEGKEVKEEIESRKAAITEQLTSATEGIAKLANICFSDSVWTIRNTWISMTDARIEICMVNEDGSRIFGSDIQINYSKWGKEEAEFYTNVGTCGKQDLLDDSFGSRTFFYIQLGELLKNKEMLQSIKDNMAQLVQQVKDAKMMMFGLEKVEKDPFNNTIDTFNEMYDEKD